jgi:hypothetical protein
VAAAALDRPFSRTAAATIVVVWLAAILSAIWLVYRLYA